ncbi:MAG: DUF1414 domain-containing protein [Pasteurellaceae bacterium]|nr:DUF1414 domain-containing protein [Pasteurellaceae bacterium]
MATQSKYQNQQIETLLHELISALEKHKAPVDLSLMALGNVVTHILANNVQNPAQQQRLADAFCDALKRSLTAK